jgi:hypothetical protein
MSLTPELLDQYDSAFCKASAEASRTRSAKVILAGKEPSPHPNYNWPIFGPPCPPATTDLPTTLASSPVAPTTHSPSVTDPAPPVGGPARPPTLLDIPLVFNILNLFQVQWFLSQEIIIKNIVAAQKDPDGAFTWVELTPQYHSFLIQSGL